MLKVPLQAYSSLTDMSNGGDSASTIAGKLAKYAYSPDSPRKLGSPSTVPATPTRPFRGSTSTPTPLRRSARKSTSRSPYFEADDDEGEDDSDEFEDLSDTPPTPSKTPKRRVESSPVKLGWKKPRGFAGPEKYAHLSNVEDCIGPNLDCNLSLPELADDSDILRD